MLIRVCGDAQNVCAVTIVSTVLKPDLTLFSFAQVISQLKVLMRSDLEAHKFDKEKWSTELSPILNLWKKLNQVNYHLAVVLCSKVTDMDRIAAARGALVCFRFDLV